MSRKAIIVGGGIAGLATARGLLGLGWDVTIYEQAPSFGWRPPAEIEWLTKTLVS